MIRNLLATTALSMLVATSAYAQQDPATTAPAPAPMEAQPAAPIAPVVASDGYLATNVIGETVYNGTADNAENIGNVNDIVLDKDGKATAVVVGVGGFLGIGERNVAVDFAQLSWAEGNGDRWLVYPATKEQLEALPEFDRKPYDPAPAPVAANDTGAMAPAPSDTMAQAPATEPAPATETAPATTDQAAQAPADQQPAATAPDTTTTAAIDKSTLTEVPADQVSADNMIGTNVYGANDENIGEISDIVLNADGKVDAVVIDVGGFLGIGAKPVAVGFDNLRFMADGNGNRYLYTQFTKEQLEAQTAYDKGTYAQQRDQQRLMVQ